MVVRLEQTRGMEEAAEARLRRRGAGGGRIEARTSGPSVRGLLDSGIIGGSSDRDFPTIATTKRDVFEEEILARREDVRPSGKNQDYVRNTLHGVLP